MAIEEERSAHVAQPVFDLPTGAVTQFEVLLRILNELYGRPSTLT